MKKFLVKLSVWNVVVLAFFVLVLYPLRFQFIADKKKTFLEKYSDKNLDLLVLGSSRAAHSIDPKLFDKGLDVFNMGQDGFGLPSNYLLLKVLIERHGIKVSNVLMQVDETAFNGTVGFSSKFRDDVFVDELDDEEVYKAYKHYRGPVFAYVVKEFPKLGNLIYCDFKKFVKVYPLAFQEYSKTLSESYQNSINTFAENKGFNAYMNPRHLPVKKDTINYVIEQDDREYFYKLADLCKKHNIKLTLFRAPILYPQTFGSQQFDQFIDSFAKKNDIAYYDYKSKYQYAQYYCDYTHFTDTIANMLTLDLKNKMKTKQAEPSSSVLKATSSRTGKENG